MSKQTAVEWLQEAISKKVNNELGPYFIDLFDNAKAMEKEQIIDAFDEGNPNGFIIKDGEQYYNETYKETI
jgi:disulfide oxidoreductase YuzD